MICLKGPQDIFAVVNLNLPAFFPTFSVSQIRFRICFSASQAAWNAVMLSG